MTLGFPGAWIGDLTVLEPYRPLFIGVALIALSAALATPAWATADAGYPSSVKQRKGA